MKKIKNISTLFLGVLSVFTNSGCDSFVEVDLPKSQLSAGTVFEEFGTADAAITNVYSKIRDTGILSGAGSGIYLQLGLYTDELDWYGSSTSASQNFYANSLLPNTAAIAEYWNSSYNQIYAANAVLEGSRASLSLSSVQKKQLEGEALFIRALLHFYLVNLYGSIPYIKTTDYKINKNAQKLTKDEIYTLTRVDLESAAQLLLETDLNSTRIRPSKSAAMALLARVYLYSGLWTEASNAASVVVNKTHTYMLEEVTKVFLKESKETIWQLQPSVAGKNTDEAAAFIFLTGPPPLTALNSGLVNSFSPTDKRRINWIGTITSGASNWFYAFKYKKNNATAVSAEFPIVMRLGEQYLIRAEARAQQGDLIGALEDLNKVHTRAGLQPVTEMDKEDLLQRVIEERKLEFFTEHAHRFFDLKRTGLINTVLKPLKHGWNESDVLLPLPQTELDLNPKMLPQNDGY